MGLLDFDEKTGLYYKKNRYNAFVVVVKSGEIIFTTPNASSLPDKPGKPYGDDLDNVVINEGIYNISSSVYKKIYSALSVSETWRPEEVYHETDDNWGKVDVTYKSNGKGRKQANQIMIHYTYGADYYNAETSLGCLTVEREDYIDFAHAVGFISQNNNTKLWPTDKKKRIEVTVNGFLIVDRSFDN